MEAFNQAARPKLRGYEFYRKVLGSPRYIVAPMVDQSELAWRTLSRRYGAQLAYTPMINAKMYANNKRNGYREVAFNTTFGEEGGPGDRPLIVQFCANDPEQLLASAKVLESHCDAVDINLGCPQDIARKGHYGSFLQDEWDLIYRLINTLHENLSIPVTAKFRVFPSLEQTVEYAKMLERAGAQILTCHGRTREQRGQNTGLADWTKIRAVKEAVSVPVFANGNILSYADITRCLTETGADATGGLHPRHADLALEYLDIVSSQSTPTTPSGIKGHLFKLLRPALSRETDLRDALGQLRGFDLEPYYQVVREMKKRMDKDAEVIGRDDADVGKELPHWVAQPYVRPLPAPPKQVEVASVTFQSV
ncbi:dihydrouridine synthase-domain-containing protein [Lactifluus volemus]|nr:dihydrouridine synthase-domain-containing protein [Lactifluus volemus]